MQAGAILLQQFTPSLDSGLPLAARLNDVRFKRIVRPGETIDIEVEMTNRTSKAWYLKARVRCEDKLAARLELTFTIAPPLYS